MAYPGNLQGLSDPGQIRYLSDAKRYIQELQDTVVELAAQVGVLETETIADFIKGEDVEEYDDTDIRKRITEVNRQVAALENRLNSLDLSDQDTPASVRYRYDATVAAAADPGAGKFRLNHATIASATEMYINDSAINGIDVSLLLGNLAEDSPIYVGKVANASQAALFKVTSATDNTGWWTIVFTVEDTAIFPTWQDKSYFTLLLPGGGGGGSDPYYFGVSIKDDDEVTVAAGRMINGTETAAIATSDVTIGTTNGTYYLSLEVWYNTVWKSAYLKDTSYPTQGTKSDSGTFPCTRALIAVVVVADNVVSSVTQVWPGNEFSNPRVAD